MYYLVGIDLGTSGVRTVIIDECGTLCGSATREYSIHTPQPGWAEQDPDTWVQTMAATTREALGQAGISPTNVAGIGFSGQMHGTVCLDQSGDVLRPAIIWADQRSAAQVAEVYRRVGREQLGVWTANPLAPGFMLATLLWLRDHEPEIYRRINRVILPKDYLRYRLTGKLGTDVTDASSTLLMDVAHRTWNAELLDYLSIEAAILPHIHESTEVAGSLRHDMAALMGLVPGVPVSYGGGDQAMQAIGNGIIRPGLLSCTIGTGGQLFLSIDTPVYDPDLRMHTFCHGVPGMWHLLAATLAAGLSLKWLRERVLGGEPYSALADAAAAVPCGAEGLLFLPYLVGERTPHMDPYAKGVFFGLTLRHGREHLVRAVMEGAVLALREGLELILGLGVSVDRIVASGGGTRHPLWLRLQADILGREIYQTETQEAAAFGAALVAGVAVGIFGSIPEACACTIRWHDEIVKPDPATVADYNEVFERYRRLYQVVREEFLR